MRQQEKTPVPAPTRKKRNPSPPAGRRARRTFRIEILCFENEKDSILRRAGNLPIGRWARAILLGRRTPAADTVPVHKLIGFAETVERLALEGDLQSLLDTARNLQRHLRATRS